MRADLSCDWRIHQTNIPTGQRRTALRPVSYRQACPPKPPGRTKRPSGLRQCPVKKLRVAGLEYSSRGVRVNCVAPGSTRTKMLYETVGQLTDDQIIDGNPHDFRLGIPLTRIAEPEDIARVVMFLTSESARNITMQSFTVDGGATLGVQ